MRLRVRLHENATATSLALARVLVFAIWTVYVLTDPVHRLALLPIELFHAHGIFLLLPESFWAALITPAGLLGFKTLLLAAFAWAAIGFRGARVVAGVAALLALTYLQVKKGFGGHWDHREMALLYVTAMLVITPAWDALAVRRSPRANSRRAGIYRASMLVLAFVIVVQYVFIGAARLFIGGPGVFLGGTLQRWVENRNLRPNPFGSDLGERFLDPVWAPFLDLSFFASTVLEIAVLAMLFLGGRRAWLKIVLAASFVSFHTAIFLLMNVAFPEDAALLLLFFDLETPLRRMRAGHTGAATLRYDPGSPAATLVAVRAQERAPDVSVEPAPDVTGGLELRADAATVTGERALTEVLYRSRGGLLRAWWRDRVRKVDGPLPPERTGVAAWFLGPLAEQERRADVGSA